MNRTSCKNGQWWITDDKVLHIDVKGDMANYNPEEAPWYSYLVYINSVDLTSTVTSIGNYSFYALNGIKTITGGSGVTKIGEGAFTGCSGLKTVYFPAVKTVGRNAFYFCSGLEQVNLPAVETLESDAFSCLDSDVYPSGKLKFVNLGANVKQLNTRSLANKGLWKDDYVPSVFMSNANAPEISGQNTYTIGKSGWWVFSTTTKETVYGYPFGTKPKATSSSLVDPLIVVPPLLVDRYALYDGKFALYYLSPQGPFRDSNTEACGHVVGGEPIIKNNRIVGWWYRDESVIHVGYEGELPSYSAGQAPWESVLSGASMLMLHDVTAIADKAFQDGKNLGNITSIYLSAPLERIGAQAFAGCTKLTSVNKPFLGYFTSSVAVDQSAFAGCTSLKFLPDLITYSEIGSYAFENCSSLTKFATPLTNFASGVFKGCSNLTEATLSSATSIGKEAFSGCSKLPSIYFGSTTPTLGESAFAGCSGLKDVYVSCEVPTTSATVFSGVTLSAITLHIDPELYTPYERHEVWGQMQVDKTYKSFVQGTMSNGSGWSFSRDNGTLVVQGPIPDFASVYDQPWYQYREHVQYVTLTSGVTSIGKRAFASMEAGISQIQSVTIPLTCKAIGEYAFQYCDQITSMDIGYVETIGSYAFSECSSLKRVIFSTQLKRLDDYIFKNCVSLTDVVNTALVKDVATCTAHTFEDINSGISLAPALNRSLAAANIRKNPSLFVPESDETKYMVATGWGSLVFPNTLEYGSIVASGTFGDGYWVLFSKGTLLCQANTSPDDYFDFALSSARKKTVTDVVIKGNLSILHDLFQGFYNLETVVLSSSVKELDGTFYNCRSLTDINLENVQKIGEKALYNCESQTKAKLSKAKEIGANAFYGCKGLVTVELGDNTKLGDQAFSGCSNIEYIDLSEADLSKGTGVFKGCSKLTEVEYRSRAIGAQMFEGCSALKIVTLGNRLDSIGYRAFTGTALQHLFVSSPTPPPTPQGTYRVQQNGYSQTGTAAWAFDELELAGINLYIPADFTVAYEKSRFWQDMNIVADESYEDPLLPTGGAMGNNGRWRLDTDGKLTISGIGDIYERDKYGFYWNRTFDPWLYYTNTVEVTDEVTTLPGYMTGYFSYQPEASSGVKTIILGENLTAARNHSLSFSGVKDVYIYATQLVQMDYGTFDVEAVVANDATLHVLKDPNDYYLIQYSNHVTTSYFPHIVADLDPRTQLAWGLALNTTSVTLQPGDTIRLTPVFTPENVANKTVRWTSSGPVAVDENGLVTALRSGDAQVTAWTTDGTNLHATCKILISEPEPEQDIYFTATNDEGIEISYHVRDNRAKTCEVLAYDEDAGRYIPVIDSEQEGSLTIPAEVGGYTVTRIGLNAFYRAEYITEARLPQTLEAIGPYAFMRCSVLHDVYMPLTTPPAFTNSDGDLEDDDPDFQNGAFDRVGEDCADGAVLHVPAGCKAAYDIYLWNYWFAKILEDAVVGIGNIRGNAAAAGAGGWHTPDGRRLSKPTQPGLYITNGKKMVIK